MVCRTPGEHAHHGREQQQIGPEQLVEKAAKPLAELNARCEEKLRRV